MTDATIATERGPMPVYLATPRGSGPWPGVVVIHDALGFTRDLRDQTDWLSSIGYLAAAPNLFHWGKRFACMRAIFSDLRARKGKSFDEIDAVRRWLAQQPGCTGRTGVIGFCMGGGFALLLAPGHGFDASSVNYGTVPKDAEAFLSGSCPIVGSFGGKDRTLRGAAVRLESALELNRVAHDVKEYPGAGHSFLNDHEPSEVPRLFKVLRPLMGSGYDEGAATDARRRIAAFFDAHLKG